MQSGGRFEHQNGDFYEGEFDTGAAHGKGPRCRGRIEGAAQAGQSDVPSSLTT